MSRNMSVKAHAGNEAHRNNNSGRNSNRPTGVGNTNNKDFTKKSLFDDYWSFAVVKVGLDNGDLHKDTVRINAKNFEEAFVDDPEGGDDVLLNGIKSRNRALHDDIVAYIINHKSNWLIRFQNLLITHPEFEHVYRQLKCAERNSEHANSGTSDGIFSTPPRGKNSGAAARQNIEQSSADRRKNLATDRNCMLASLTSPDDEDAKSESSVQLVSRAAVGYDPVISGDVSRDVPRIEKLSVSSSHSEKDPNDGEGGILGMDDVKLPMNISYEEMETLISMIPGAENNIDLREHLVKTGKVVRILDMCHSRRCVGKIKPFARANIRNALFAPLDSKIPRLRIPLEECPPDFLKNPEQYKDVIFAAKIVNWKSDDMFAVGSLMKQIGDVNALEQQLEILLIENGITWYDTEDFPPAVEASCLEILGCESGSQWQPSQQDLQSRKDFQSHTVISIDPPTARDLDDALHCVELEKGIFEVGVHIADVSHFVKEGTPLDDEASMRTTSTYMPNRVIPMLPRALCEHVCSLQPDKSRLAFSVVFKIDQEGKVLSQWIGKSVIKSCCQMSYDYAQKIIDEPDCTSGDIPSVPGEKFEQVKQSIIHLHLLAQTLKNKRFENGALKIQKRQIGFLLDPHTGQPGSFFHHRGMESHSLIEEFMLLANISVAEKLCNSVSEFAFLRRHDPPKRNMLAKIQKECVLYDFTLEDGSTSGGISECLDTLYSTLKDKHFGKYMFLVELFSKKMQLAKYFCMGAHENKSFSHYALNVPFYTHFTSPIRRYPDIIVHRQLYAALCAEEKAKEEVCSNASFSSSTITEAEDPDFKYNIYCQELSEERSEKQIKKLSEIAHHCNVNKLAAKRVGEGSIEVFFVFFVKDNGPIEMEGTVVGVLDQSIDVLLHDLHAVKRLYYEQNEGVEVVFHKHPAVPQKNTIDIKFKTNQSQSTPHSSTLKFFSPLKVSVSVATHSSKLTLKFVDNPSI